MTCSTKEEPCAGSDTAEHRDKPGGQYANEYSLTDRARALLETRARLDGGTP